MKTTAQNDSAGAAVVTRDQIWALMRMSSVGIAPYIAESSFLQSLPNKPIEYMAGGLAVATAINGFLGNLLRNNGCGFVYRNAVELATSIRSFREDPEQLSRMQNNARALFEREFRAEKVYTNLSRFLLDVAETGPITH